MEKRISLPSFLAAQISDYSNVNQETEDSEEACLVPNDFQYSRDPGPDVYVHLSNNHNNRPVNFSIPETLIKSSKLASPVFLYSENSSIKAYTKNDALSFFFSSTETNQENEYKYPKYVHIAGSHKVTLCKTSQHAIRVWAQCRDSYQLLQKYVICGSFHAEKVRVFWNYSENSKYYKIKNRGEISKSEAKSQKSLISRKRDNVYMYKTKDFTFAGRILKTSFCPSFPYRPNLTSLESNINMTLENSSPHLPQIKADEKEVFLVKSQRGTNSDTYLVKQEAAVEAMINKLVKFLEESVDRPENTKIVELVADFIQDKQGNWFLLNCKGHKIDYIQQGNRVKYRSKKLTITKSINNTRVLAEMLHIHEETKKKNPESVINAFKQRIEKLNVDDKKLKRNYAFYNPKDSIEEMTKMYFAERRAPHIGNVPVLMIGTHDHSDMHQDDH